MAVHLTRDGDVVDAIALAAFGHTVGATEAILAANPQLAGVGPVLPAGLVVTLPAIAAQTPAPTIRLWD